MNSNTLTLEQANHLIGQIRTEVGKALIGQASVIHETLVALLAVDMY